MARPPLKPQIVYRDGKPSAVILDIAAFEAILDELEELEDLRAVDEVLKQPLDTVAFDDYMAQLRARLRAEEERGSLHDRDSSSGEAAA